MLKLAELLIFEWSLFHPDMIEGKSEFLKQSCLTLIEGMLLLRQVLWIFKLSFKLNEHEGDFWVFFNQFFNCRDSKPNSSNIFSLEVPLIAPVLILISVLILIPLIPTSLFVEQDYEE